MARKDAADRQKSRRQLRFGWSLIAGLVLVTCLGVRYHWGPSEVGAQQEAPPAQADVSTSGEPSHDVMAIVNQRRITRQSLAAVCLERFGETVLESLVNRRLVAAYCKQHNVVVTQEEVDAEIERNASNFKLGVTEWLRLLEERRGVSAEQYARDIVWPTVALQKLAADRLKITSAELQKEYESEFGPAVNARIIALKSHDKANEVHALATTGTEEFARLAHKFSEDINSASAGGLIPPVRRHIGSAEIEQTVFALQVGEVSPVIKVGEQYVFFKCEGHIPDRNVPMAEVQDRLADRIRDRKLRKAADEIFAKLQSSADVVNVWNDEEKRAAMPGVAATVNRDPVMLSELSAECIDRYGEQVLEGEINRVLVEDALAKAQLKVTRADLETEIGHAAKLAGVMTPEGHPDMKQWAELVTDKGEIEWEHYIRDRVWPSVALKKLVRSKVEVTEEDIRKGFEANYGRQVRCRAIVMGNQRRAQEVWDEARQNLNVEAFGELAAKFSLEPNAKALKGEVPPIRRYGGQPHLEEHAFKLNPETNPLSGVIQVGDKYVILFCEGYEDPVKVEIDRVRELLVADITEKKLRIAMATEFEKIRDSSKIVNLLSDKKRSEAGQRSAQQAGPPIR